MCGFLSGGQKWVGGVLGTTLRSSQSLKALFVNLTIDRHGKESIWPLGRNSCSPIVSPQPGGGGAGEGGTALRKPLVASATKVTPLPQTSHDFSASTLGIAIWTSGLSEVW